MPVWGSAATKLLPLPAWPASAGRQRPPDFSTMNVPLRVPTRIRSVMSASAQRLHDEHPRVGADRIAQRRPVLRSLVADEHVDVGPQPATLVAHIEGEAGRNLFHLAHHLAQGGCLDGDLASFEVREEAEEMAGQLDLRHGPIL